MKTFQEYTLIESEDLPVKEKVSLMNLDQAKPIHHSILVPEVKQAFDDFTQLASEGSFCVIGGLAMGAHVRPRTTTDVDVLVSSKETIVDLEMRLRPKFKKIRPSAFEHISTGVEVEVITPELIGISQALADLAIQDARIDQVKGKNVRIASPKFMIALKLGRASESRNARSMQDQTDITKLLQICGPQNLDDLHLSEREKTLYDQIVRDMNEQ